MILQALADYYQRLADEGSGDVAPEGFQSKEIPFLITIDRQGRFKGFIDTREGEGKNRRARSFMVPREEKRAGQKAWEIANLLWDNQGYVLGCCTKKDQGQQKALDKAQGQHSSFRKRIEDTFTGTRPAAVQAVLAFLEHPDQAAMSKDPIWPEIMEKGGNLTFRLDGETRIICEDPEVIKALSGTAGSKSAELGQCLVSGQADRIKTLHNAIKGVWGAQPMGANIVSFNLDAFCSYGKQQGLNAPVGEKAEFAYITALNRLLSKGSRQRIQVGDASTVFWAERQNPIENWFADFFAEPPKGESQQDNLAVRELFAAPASGRPPIVEDMTRFYVLGLSPNASRIAIRFWHAGTVGEVATAVRQHFEDLAIVHGPVETEHLSIFRLLVSTAMQGKSDNITPNLAGDFMRAILEGTPYPGTLLGSALRRIRAEHEITYPRASLIKAVLARQARYRHQSAKEVGMSLDRSNDNVAYRLGRVFAFLERAQEAANPGINATIRDRFYGAASSTPVTVFPLLLKLKNHHLSKLDNRGLADWYEKEIGEIIDGVPSRFPAHLSLDDQGRFAIGYYHQRQDFYRKKESREKKEEDAI